MSEIDILRYIVGALLTVSGAIGTALIGLLVWVARILLRRIDGLGAKMDSFDKRVMRLELRQQVRPVHGHYRAGDK